MGLVTGMVVGLLIVVAVGGFVGYCVHRIVLALED